jgi:hypothetical protein
MSQSGVVVHNCNSSTWEVEPEGSRVLGQPVLHSEERERERERKKEREKASKFSELL